jgi:hypothetical protein
MLDPVLERPRYQVAMHLVEPSHEIRPFIVPDENLGKRAVSASN